jgi:hypothetical protein
MSLDHLISKILAGGLTAGVFLLWWPRHFPAEGLEWLVIRGLLWTLVFELLLVAFAPVETMLMRRVDVRLQRRRDRVRARIQSTPAGVRTGGVVAVACVGLVVPLALLSDVAKNPLLPDEPKPKVVRQVIVKKPVVHREVVVRRVVEAAPAASSPSAASLAASPRQEAASTRPKASTRTNSTTPKKQGSSTTKTAAKTETAPKTAPATTPAAAEPEPTSSPDAAAEPAGGPFTGSAATTPAP